MFKVSPDSSINGVWSNYTDEKINVDNSNVTTPHLPEPIAPIPPPGGNLENRQPPLRSSRQTDQPGIIKTENLQVAQEIQSMHADFTNLNEYEQTNLNFSLANAGLPKTGAIFNATI